MIRAARRDVRQTRTVRLSPRAHARLHQFAKREQFTLSETIERYLSDLPDVTATWTRQDTPPTTEQTHAKTTVARRGSQERMPSAAVPQKHGNAFITTQKGVCYVTIKRGRTPIQILRIRNSTIDAEEKRRLRRRYPDIAFDWKKITRQLAEKREVCRRYRSRRRTVRVSRARARAVLRRDWSCGAHGLRE